MVVNTILVEQINKEGVIRWNKSEVLVEKIFTMTIKCTEQIEMESFESGGHNW